MSVILDLHPSAAETAAGAGGAMASPTLTMLEVFLDVTAHAGTTPVFNAWLQSSWDAGTSWFDVPYDQQLNDAEATAADQTANTNKRNVNGTANVTASPFQSVTNDAFGIPCESAL